MSHTEFKKGDRVRVTFEGKITATAGSGHFRVGASVPANGPYGWVFASHMEKLVDPEPDWVNGDLIRIRDDLVLTYMYDKGEWPNIGSDVRIKPDQVTTCWQRGEVKVLYKADA